MHPHPIAQNCRWAVAVALALSFMGPSLGQTFNVPASQIPQSSPLGTVSGGVTNTTGGFFRISNIFGVEGAPSEQADLESVTTATAPNTPGNASASDNYLSRIGRFTFAVDNPILDVTLTLAVDSVYSASFGQIGTLTTDPDAGTFDRSPFLMHDFGLLFIGNQGTEFIITRDSGSGSIRDRADWYFSVSNPGGIPKLQYVATPTYAVDGDGNTIVDANGVPVVTPQLGQILSQEWEGFQLADETDDLNWQPNGNIVDHRTFPVTADTAGIVTSPKFYLTRGTATASATALYQPGSGNTYWDVYLFSTGGAGTNTITGPGGIGNNLQLNLSSITVTLVVPESGQAFAAGTALVMTAGALWLRRRG